MVQYILFLGKLVPLYGICFYVGILMSSLVAWVLVRRKQPFPVFDLVCCSVYVMIGGLLGSKLLFLLVSWKEIIALHLSWLAILKGGFVFYGGLFGGLLGVLIYCKKFKMEVLPFLELFSTVLPLGHSIGRIGCLFAGCCYGIPHEGKWSIIYHQTMGVTPLEIPLFPVQLVEAVLLFLLFLILLAVYFRGKAKGRCICVYGFSYGVIRFCLEFLRGDAERGVFGGISTSQWISLLFACFIAFFMLKNILRGKAQKR